MDAHILREAAMRTAQAHIDRLQSDAARPIGALLSPAARAAMAPARVDLSDAALRFLNEPSAAAAVAIIFVEVRA